MYGIRNEAEVGLGRSGEFEAVADEWASIQAQNAGFIGGTLLQSYANPGRYTLFSRWLDREAAVAAGRREQFVSFAETFRNSGVARPTRLSEAYESVFEVDQPNVMPSDSTAERWIDFTLRSPAVAPTFEDRARELAEVARQHAPGVLSIRLRRSMGSDTKYLMLVITTDRAAARGWLVTPEVRAFVESNSIDQALVGTPSAEIFHVVKRYEGPASATVATAVAGATGRG